MVDLAQAVLAFLGEPGRAKDRARDIFEDESLYAKVFPGNVRPEQLLLAWSVYKTAEKRCGEWQEQFRGAQYARFCLTAIVGSELAPNHHLPSIGEASKLAAHQDRIDAIIKRGQTAVASRAADDDYPGPREFFRSPEAFEKVLGTYRRLPPD